MRKFILITALVLVSASAQAGVSRNLTMASNDEPVAAEPSKAVDVKAVEPSNPATSGPSASEPKASEPKASEPAASEAPKFVERPTAVDVPVDQPKVDTGKPVPDKRVEKPRRRRESTEARVIYELHRHGIYW